MGGEVVRARGREKEGRLLLWDVNDVQMCNLVSQEKSVYGAVNTIAKNTKQEKKNTKNITFILREREERAYR